MNGDGKPELIVGQSDVGALAYNPMFKLEDDGRGTLFFKEPVYHMFDFMANGAEQVVTWDRTVMRVYGYRAVKAKHVARDSEYKRNSVTNHTHY